MFAESFSTPLKKNTVQTKISETTFGNLRWTHKRFEHKLYIQTFLKKNYVKIRTYVFLENR